MNSTMFPPQMCIRDRNSISPGWIDTGAFGALSPEDGLQHPSGRVGTPGHSLHGKKADKSDNPVQNHIAGLAGIHGLKALSLIHIFSKSFLQ